MGALQLVGFGVASTLLALTLRRDRPEMAVIVSVAAGLCLFAAVVSQLQEIVGTLTTLAAKADLKGPTLTLLLRIIGIAALCEIGAQICRDAGEGGIAAKIEMGGKLMVLALAMPIAVALVEMLMKVLP